VVLTDPRRGGRGGPEGGGVVTGLRVSMFTFEFPIV